MAHKPKTMSDLYSHFYEELDLHSAEAEREEYGFDLPKTVIVPNVRRKSRVKSESEVAA